jgi:hypothetical protein
MSQPPANFDPVPVQPLQYVMPPAYRGRPGLVTAIGVISIIVAAVSMLSALFTGMQAAGFYMMSMMSSTVAGARAARVAPVVPPSRPLPVNGAAAAPLNWPRGMDERERLATVNTLTQLRPMTPRRLSQLDTILAQAGKDLATDHVTASGAMPAPQSGETAPDYFDTTSGRLLVYDDRAVFFPSNNGPAVRVSAPPGAPAGAPPAAAATQGADAVVTFPSTGPATVSALPSLTPAEIQSVVQQARAAGSPPLNAAQVQALQGLLSAPGQQLVPPGSSQGAISAVYNGGGSSPAVVQFAAGGSVTLSPTGAVTNVMTMPVMPTIAINPLYLTTMAVSAIASMGLAVYLLVCGILALRQSQRARRWHLIYAGIKIPLAIVGAVASALVMRDMFGSMGAAGGASPTLGFSLGVGAVPLVLGCAYPVALLIALNLKQVKDYYAAGAGQALSPA